MCLNIVLCACSCSCSCPSSVCLFVFCVPCSVFVARCPCSVFVLLLCVAVLVRVFARCSCSVVSFVFFVIVPGTASVRGLVLRSCYLLLFL